MTLPLSPELRCRIFAPEAQKYPFYMIFKELQKQNFTVTRTVSNVLKKDKNGNKNPAMTGSLVKKKYHSDISTPLVNKKVKTFTVSNNILAQQNVTRFVGVSQAIANRIIHHNHNSSKKMKAKVHHLHEKMIVQREERA